MPGWLRSLSRLLAVASRISRLASALFFGLLQGAADLNVPLHLSDNESSLVLNVNIRSCVYSSITSMAA